MRAETRVLRVFGATEDVPRTQQVLAGQARCYARFGSEQAMQARSCVLSPAVYMVTAEDRGGHLLGAFRVHLDIPGQPLPIESALAHEPRALASIRARGGRLAELSGLWIEDSQRKTGLSKALVQATVAAAEALGATAVFLFTHQHLHPLYTSAGFTVDAVVGGHAYPDPRYVSRIYWTDPTRNGRPDVQAEINSMRAALAKGPCVLWNTSSRTTFNPAPAMLGASHQATSEWSKIMSKPNAQFRPMEHLTLAEEKRAINERFSYRESQLVKPHADANVLRRDDARRDELLDVDARVDGALGRRVALYLAGHEQCVASVDVVPAEEGSLGTLAGLPRTSLDKSAQLAGLYIDPVVADQEDLVPTLLYVAARRARLAGRHTLVALLSDETSAVARALALLPMGHVAPITEQRSGEPARAYRAMAQRIDYATHIAHRAATTKVPFASSFFMQEVTETLERWMFELWDTSWFRAIYDGTLTKEQYVYSLANMHQFVRWTTRILARCVGWSHDKTLRNHFLDHLTGEINHEVIIERDLAHLSADVDFVMQQMVPNRPTHEFMVVQESVIGFHHSPLLLMASPLAAEGMTAHLDDHFMECLQKCVQSWGVDKPKKATMFWSSHINTDGGESGHWQATLDAVQEHLRTEADAQQFLGVMKMSMAALTRAYDSFVADLSIWSVPEQRVDAVEVESLSDTAQSASLS